VGKEVMTSNISYLIQYGCIRKIEHNGSTQILKSELEKYYRSLITITKIRLIYVAFTAAICVRGLTEMCNLKVCLPFLSP
jgi:hypothetical protein